jgi:hypothetical protein
MKRTIYIIVSYHSRTLRLLQAMNMDGKTGAGSTFGCWRDHVTGQSWDGFPYAVATSLDSKSKSSPASAGAGTTGADVCRMVVCPNSIDADTETVRQPWSKPDAEDTNTNTTSAPNSVFPSSKKARHGKD